MRTRTITIASLAAMAALVFSACGGSESAGTATGSSSETKPTSGTSGAAPPNRVTVKMGEWFFRLSHERVKAGKVTVIARDVGEIEHELIALRTDLPADEMPMTAEGLDADKAGKLVIGKPHEHSHGDETGDGHMDDEAGHGDDEAGHEHADDEAGHGHMDEAAEQGHLEPGETRRYKVDLKPGNYVLLCSIPGHYQMGQYATLTVVP